MRLFVAIPLPLQVQEHIRSLQQKLPSDVRRVRPHQCHLTLKFLGTVKDVKHVVRELSSISHPAFDITLDTIGGFPTLIQPRVIFLEGERSYKLSALAMKVDDVTREVIRDKPFRPHVTFARNSSLKFSAVEIDTTPLTFKAHEFVLYASEPRAEGPVHTVVERFTLG